MEQRKNRKTKTKHLCLINQKKNSYNSKNFQTKIWDVTDPKEGQGKETIKFNDRKGFIDRLMTDTQTQIRDFLLTFETHLPLLNTQPLETIS